MPYRADPASEFGFHWHEVVDGDAMKVDRTPVNELNDDPLAEIDAATAFSMLPSGNVDIGRVPRGIILSPKESKRGFFSRIKDTILGSSRPRMVAGFHGIFGGDWDDDDDDDELTDMCGLDILGAPPAPKKVKSGKYGTIPVGALDGLARRAILALRKKSAFKPGHVSLIVKPIQAAIARSAHIKKIATQVTASPKTVATVNRGPMLNARRPAGAAVPRGMVRMHGDDTLPSDPILDPNADPGTEVAIPDLPKANGRAWVANQTVSPLGLTYPDGTPMVMKLAFPALKMGMENGTVEGERDYRKLKPVPSGRLIGEQAPARWMYDTSGIQDRRQPNVGWVDFRNGVPRSWPFSVSYQPEKCWYYVIDESVFLDTDGQRRAVNPLANFGIDLSRANGKHISYVPGNDYLHGFSGDYPQVYYFKADFDWRDGNPIDKAYIWCFWFLGADVATNLRTFTLLPAMLEDGSAPGSGKPASSPHLPGLALLDMNLRDAIFAGVHGLQNTISADGTFDTSTFDNLAAAAFGGDKGDAFNRPQGWTALTAFDVAATFGSPGQSKQIADAKKRDVDAAKKAVDDQARQTAANKKAAEDQAAQDEFVRQQQYKQEQQDLEQQNKLILQQQQFEQQQAQLYSQQKKNGGYDGGSAVDSEHALPGEPGFSEDGGGPSDYALPGEDGFDQPLNPDDATAALTADDS